MLLCNKQNSESNTGSGRFCYYVLSIALHGIAAKFFLNFLGDLGWTSPLYFQIQITPQLQSSIIV